LFSNERIRFPGVDLGLLQDRACTDLFENLSVKSLKGDLLKATTFNPSLFSLANTFNQKSHIFVLLTAFEKMVRFMYSGDKNIVTTIKELDLLFELLRLADQVR
jgi:hypothetical protein